MREYFLAFFLFYFIEYMLIGIIILSVDLYYVKYSSYMHLYLLVWSNLHADSSSYISNYNRYFFYISITGHTLQPHKKNNFLYLTIVYYKIYYCYIYIKVVKFELNLLTMSILR